MSRCTRPDRVDVAVAHVVRLVVDDAWAVRDAASALIDRVTDRAVLERVRTRVSSALDARPGVYGERAVATLDAALALGTATGKPPIEPASAR